MTLTDPRADLPLIDLSEPEAWSDLRATLAAARARSPVARTPDGGLWVLSHAGVELVLRSRSFEAPDLAESHGGSDSVIGGWAAQLMGSLNGEEHRRIRGIVTKVFSARTAEELRPAVRQILDELFTEYFATGESEVLGHLPGRVMTRLMGLPASDYAGFAAWVDDLSQFFSYNLNDPEVADRVQRAIQALDTYLRAHIESPQTGDEPDLLHRLVEPRPGGALTVDQAVIAATNLLAAGTDTVHNSIEMFWYLLATHPVQFALLQSSPELIPGAVDELLRYEPPAPLHVRRAVEDVTIEGQLIRSGEMVMLAPIIADRDPDVWERPDELEVARVGAPRIQAFGGGPHVCLGAALARMQLQEFLSALVVRADHLEATGTPRFQPYQTLRRMLDIQVGIIAV